MYCIYNTQTDEARHTNNKSFANIMFGKINSGYMSEIINDKENILCTK